MSNKFLMGFVGASALLIGITVSPLPAFAGFQWVAPESSSNQPSVATYPSGPVSSSAMNAPEVISPVIISGNTMPSSQIAQPYAPPAPALQMPPQPTTQPMAPTPYYRPNSRIDLSTATVNMQPSSGGDIVQGFAAQVPLALALRQILPPTYNFSIDQDVSMDMSVSYKGGKSWRDTAYEMLASVGLMGREQGTTLVVSHIGASPSPAPAISNGDTISISSTPSISQSPSFNGTVPVSVSGAHDMQAYNVGPADGWTAEHGDTLHKVLTQWCSRAGVELQWLAEYDYPVEASAHFSGSFEEAVRSLLSGFETARPQPIGELHSNPNAGQMVLVVSPRGNSYSN